MIRSFRTQWFYRFFCLLGALTLLITALPHAAAGSLVNSSYEVAIASSERLLSVLGTEYEEAVMESESCDNPHYRVQARNRPAVMVTNVTEGAAPGDELTSFTLRIMEGPEGPYLFGTGDNSMDGFNGKYFKNSIFSDPSVQITSLEPSPDMTLLTVNFDGLSAGKSVIFRVDLDVDPDPKYADLFPFPDFRQVLFGGDGDEEGVPGTTSATFTSGDESATTPETPLAGDFDIVYEGENTRPYRVMDPIIPGGGGGTVIPEPASLLLLLTGLVSMSVWRRTGR